MHPTTRRGQSSFEQLIVVALGIGMVTLVFYYSVNLSSDNIRISQAEDMVEKLSKSADYVYSLGPGSKDVVDVYVPEGMVLTDITNNSIRVRLSLSSGESDVFADTKPVIIGEIPPIPGHHRIAVTHTQSGKVMLGEGSLFCSPFTITKSIVQGESASDSITIKDIGDYTIENITATLDGFITDMTVLTQPASSLDPLQTTTAGLEFTVPAEKEVGSYSGMVTVRGNILGNITATAAECSTFITIFVLSSKPPDDAGPIVTVLTHKPKNPSVYTPVLIKATGDDTATGGSDVIGCQVELDGSGIWNDMLPVDGKFDQVIESAEYTIGPLGEGDHFVRVRCIDEYMNVGPEKQDNFTVRYYKKEILFITDAATPNAEEQLWIDWLSGHSSNEGYMWNYDIVPRASVTAGTVNASSYQIVMFANYPNTDPTLDAEMIAYRNTAHYLVFLGEAMKFGVPNMGLATGNSGTHSRPAIRVQAEHYITTGYAIYGYYNVTNASFDMYYHPSFEAAKIVSMDDSDSRTVIGDAGYVVTYGPTRPDMFTDDGHVFATRVIDHALLES
jgi:uncharacterized protein (UPF0333 family)